MTETVAQPTVSLSSATRATFDPEGITEQTAPYFRVGPSPLSLLHPEMATETARRFQYGRVTAAQVRSWPGDETFNAEVALVMATLEASSP